MWPWTHLAFGLLVYICLLRLARVDMPSGWAFLALALGTQFPDLVDKPLAWYLHVLPYGRTLAHSLLVAVPVLLVVGWYADRRGARPIGVAFAIGYLSHLVGDAVPLMLAGWWTAAGFLVWPLVEPPAHETVGLLDHLAKIQLTPDFLFGLGLTAVGLLVWIYLGGPGVSQVRDVLTR